MDLESLRTAIHEELPSATKPEKSAQLRLYKPGAIQDGGRLQGNFLYTKDIRDLETAEENPLIVIVPPAASLPADVHLQTTLLQMARVNLDGWDRTSEQRTRVQSETTKTNVLAYYGIRSATFCQILGGRTKHVVNAHIWPVSNKVNLILVGLEPSEINDPRNVLRLHPDLERFFDHKQICFDWHGQSLKLNVLDKSILQHKLKGKSKIMADVQGKSLRFFGDKRPWRRLIATHSVLSHRHALQVGWVANNDLSTAELNASALAEFSLDEEAQDRLRRLWASQ